MYSACMGDTVAIQIRDVPVEWRDALAARAKTEGRSMQAYLLDVLERQARHARNIDLLDGPAARAVRDRIAATLPPGADFARVAVETAQELRDGTFDGDRSWYDGAEG